MNIVTIYNIAASIRVLEELESHEDHQYLNYRLFTYYRNYSKISRNVIMMT